MAEDVNSYQVGGDHYAQGGEAQHWDWVERNGIGYLEGCATKYVTRWRNKHGIRDLQKATHYIKKLIALHREGVRFNRLTNHKIDMMRFEAANKLQPWEAHVCGVLMFWREEWELTKALETIEEAIAANKDYQPPTRDGW